MEIKAKRVDEPFDRRDGFRVLVERAWPDGVRKEDLVLDAWAKCLAPQPKVYEGLGEDPQDSLAFEARYRKQLDSSQRAAAYVHSLQDGNPEMITLLYTDHGKPFSHAPILASWLREKSELAALPPDDRPTKTPSQSAIQAVHTVVHECMNGEDRLFGGRLMEWIDDIAGVCARRHCGGSITTACIDTLTFLNPAFLNDIIILKARVTYVGRTSLEVRVDSYVEDVATGEHKLINSAYLTEVFMDKNNKPTPIAYGLRPTTVADREEYEGAQRRIEVRKARAKAGF